MKTTEHNFNRLINDILWQPPESADEESPIDDDRLLDVLQGEGAFTDEEERTMMTSPAARQRFSELYAMERYYVAKRMREEAQVRPIHVQLAVADDGMAQPLHLDGKGYKVHLYPLGPEGDAWKMVVDVKAVPQGLSHLGFRLEADDEVWLRGKPNQEGELVAFFTAEDRLKERISGRQLMLQPN